MTPSRIGTLIEQVAEFRRVEPDVHRPAAGEQIAADAGDDLRVIGGGEVHFGRRGISPVSVPLHARLAHA